jgi:hypothetical protein
MGDRPAYIEQQARSRSLLKALSPAQEFALASQGASSDLLQALRDPQIVLSDAEAHEFEAQAERHRVAIEASIARDQAEAHERALVLAHAAAQAPPAYEAPHESPSVDADYLPSYYDGGGFYGTGGNGGRGRFNNGNGIGRSSKPGGAPGASFHGNAFNPTPNTALHGPGSFTSASPTFIAPNAVFTPARGR